MDLTLIIFAALALFLSYRLFNVLGTRGGHEPDESERPVLRPVGAGDRSGDAAQARSEQATPREELPEWAREIADVYPAFAPKEFLEGAGKAYEMVVQAYADGDLSDVRGFVDPDVQKSFDVAIEGREAKGQTVELTFVGVETPEVVGVERDGDQIRAELKFRSEQVRIVRDADGNLVEGSEEQVVDVIDRWIFARHARSNDPNWTLVATHGSA